MSDSKNNHQSKARKLHRFFQLFTVCVLGMMVFTYCKKYPKNYLICKKPEVAISRINENRWKLIYYSVNDIDSTSSPFLDGWKQIGINIDGLGKYGKSFYCDKILIGGWSFSKNKKEMSFSWGSTDFTNTGSYVNPEYPNQRNIFLSQGLIWKIDKLTKNELRLVTEYSNRKFEMHFK